MDLQKELLSMQKPFEKALSELIGYKGQLEAICNSISADLSKSTKVHKVLKQDREVVLNYLIKTFPNPVNAMFVPKFKQDFLKFAQSQDALADLLKFMADDEGFPQQDEMTIATFRGNLALHLTKLDTLKAQEYLNACLEIVSQLEETLPPTIESCCKRGLALMQADSGVDSAIMTNFEEIVSACDGSYQHYREHIHALKESNADTYSSLSAHAAILAELLLKETAQFSLLMQILQFNSLKLSGSSFVEPAKANMPEIPFAKITQS